MPLSIWPEYARYSVSWEIMQYQYQYLAVLVSNRSIKPQYQSPPHVGWQSKSWPHGCTVDTMLAHKHNQHATMHATCNQHAANAQPCAVNTLPCAANTQPCAHTNANLEHEHWYTMPGAHPCASNIHASSSEGSTMSFELAKRWNCIGHRHQMATKFVV